MCLGCAIYRWGFPPIGSAFLSSNNFKQKGKVEMAHHATGKLPPLDHREFMAFAVSILGKGYVARHFAVSERTVERWTAQREYVSAEESIRRNPGELYQSLKDILHSRGHRIEVHGIEAFEAGRIGCELMCEEEIVPDKERWEDEVWDDLPAFAEYQTAVRRFMDGLIEARELKGYEWQLVREIKETTVKVMAEKANGRGP